MELKHSPIGCLEQIQLARMTATNVPESTQKFAANIKAHSRIESLPQDKAQPQIQQRSKDAVSEALIGIGMAFSDSGNPFEKLCPVCTSKAGRNDAAFYPSDESALDHYFKEQQEALVPRLLRT
ncbi:hypothetical protein MMC12_004326 [Toensbergia leucococca]|nr:hypothetical protein [Toensbergia leucococca]